ncbi:MAG: hypothetical protein M0Z95_15185 [Actinomycetota bacterium]|jgi:hypothetical protein|nr:hypothetical protein [Actinomycetota bacterium]
MPGARLSRAEIERRLERCRADYEAAKARVAEIGFLCEGTLLQLRTTCGNPNCRCAQPEGRHGPYWQLTWKEAGRTVTRVLSEEAAAHYREWTANRRRLEALLAEMRALSREAGEYVAAQAGFNFEGPRRSSRRRRSGR